MRRFIEAISIDDALDVLNLLVNDVLAKSQKDGKKNRLRTIKDLDAAALRLATTCRVLLHPTTEDNRVKKEVLQKLTPEELSLAIAVGATSKLKCKCKLRKNLRKTVSQK